ncbi:glycosyltransferase family 2 protein [Streptomyces sp. x-45]|uniref:glycosyltransferase family 2 protein n=1 Tax=Streptomyces sp. x-45 TaxID=2789281 RepID=UPI0022C58C16|nr:hypothetical protein [Streptomyces diastatochromogenes]
MTAPVFTAPEAAEDVTRMRGAFAVAFDLAWRLYAASWSGWYATDIHMHHPLTDPARHALYHRLAARNRIWIAYRNLPAPLLPVYLSVWTTITLARAVHGGGLGQTLRGVSEGGGPGVCSGGGR